MEFSFDTTPNQSRRPALNRSPQGRESHDSNFGSDRLQKAIERNRAKQAKRSTGRSSSLSSSSSTQQDITESLKQRLLKKREAMQTSGTQRSLPTRSPRTLSRSSARADDHGDIVVVPKSRATRRNVAVGGKATFSQPQKKSKKLPAPIRYLGLGKGTTSSKKRGKKLVEHLVVFGWVCMAVLGGRLMFSDRGVLDYYKHRTVLETIKHDISQLEIDNKELLQEIEKIKTSSRYQKKIVRDYLGFIAKNEYLVLFAKGRSPASDEISGTN